MGVSVTPLCARPSKSVPDIELYMAYQGARFVIIHVLIRRRITVVTRENYLEIALFLIKICYSQTPYIIYIYRFEYHIALRDITRYI